MPLQGPIVGIGEALFDQVDGEDLLGGAPLNLILQAHQLGNPATMVSRVGRDDLGDRLVRELAERGLETAGIQRDEQHPTGTVQVDVGPGGEPSYTITESVAWDHIAHGPDLLHRAQTAAAVCFGTLAQRAPTSRETIERFVGAAEGALRLLDVNLRQDFYDRRILTRSLELATACKLNRDELDLLNRMLDLGGDPDEAAGRLLGYYDLQWLALTQGAQGTAVYTRDGLFSAPPVPADPGGDAVGAGDATAATLLHGALRAWDWPRTLRLANTLGAHVASCRGATPPLPEAIRRLAD